jgi:hypothetical protein
MADVSMPSVLVLVVCKVLFVGEPDENSKYTNWRNTEWDLSGGVMHCRSQEVELVDSAALQGADEMPFTPIACMRAAMTMGPAFDVQYKDKPWRFWRAACPTPIRSGPKASDPIIGWKIPECPRKDGMVVCEGGSEI